LIQKVIQQFHNLYTSTDIVSVTNSRSVRWEGKVARATAMRYTYRI